jgi:hypothetical protein
VVRCLCLLCIWYRPCDISVSESGRGCLCVWKSRECARGWKGGCGAALLFFLTHLGRVVSCSAVLCRFHSCNGDQMGLGEWAAVCMWRVGGRLMAWGGSRSGSGRGSGCRFLLGLLPLSFSLCGTCLLDVSLESKPLLVGVGCWCVSVGWSGLPLR